MADGNPDSNQPHECRRPPTGVDQQQDGLLPIANVGRIMKLILKSNAKISKEAKETMQECASEFIGFVTGEAADRCRKEKRKTMNGDDIVSALAELGFDDYVQPMKLYLSKYREHEAAKAAAAGAGVGVGVGAGAGSSVGSVYPDRANDGTIPMPLFGASLGREHLSDKASYSSPSSTSSSSSSYKDPLTRYGRRI